MWIFALLLFAVGCWGIRFNAIDDFKEIFKEHSLAAIDTISSIENILDNSKNQSVLFLNKTYSNNPAVKIITDMRLSDDKCFAKFIDKDNLKLSFQIQIYQLQVPLQNRIVDIWERLNKINSSIEIYQKLAQSKYRSCESIRSNCNEEVGQWLEPILDSLSCAIYPNCSNHSVQKRSTCSPNEFRCKSDDCISSHYFCNSDCNCNDCSDEPPDCASSCSEFRCSETFRCIPYSRRCNGIDDCGDGTDENGCPPTTTPSYMHVNCSIDSGDFLCGSKKCIGLERVCDGYNDCGDWTDEGDHCDGPQCPPECGMKGGVCFTEPKGPKCLNECPPGTYETSKGCSRNQEAPLPTLIQVLEDTPRLTKRYAARLKFLKTKTIMAFSSALREVVKCKNKEFTLLSKIIDFSYNIYIEGRASKIGAEVYPEIPKIPVDVIASSAETLTPSTEETVTSPSTEETVKDDYYVY